jgi:HEPN/RES N-terminal domain 1/RES domain
VPVDVVLELLVSGLLYENEDPVHQVAWSSADGGWQMPWVDTEDLLIDYDITDDDALRQDLVNAITIEQWVQRDPYAAAPHERDFTADVAKPAHPDDHQHLEYVPTQVVAEYLRFRYRHEHQPIMGVLWRSSVDADAEDCVLFVDNRGCVEAQPGWTENPDAWLGMLPSSLEFVTA